MSLEQIARTMDTTDTNLVEKATILARKARKIATDIDSCYCRELNRGFSRDLVNKLKISGKVCINLTNNIGCECETSIRSRIRNSVY
jgi:hypothetical protein